MKDTFEKNLAEAIATEKAAIKAYKDLMKTLKDAEKEMNDSYDKKQELLGDDDDDLADKRKLLSEAIKKKDNDQEYLDKLIPMCKEKTDDYEERKLLRANEEAAIAEAISILNSDAAFATFGGVDATSLIQLRSVRRHMTGTAMTQKKAHIEEELKVA